MRLSLFIKHTMPLNVQCFATSSINHYRLIRRHLQRWCDALSVCLNEEGRKLVVRDGARVIWPQLEQIVIGQFV